jgi:hypothetical protein
LGCEAQYPYVVGVGPGAIFFMSCELRTSVTTPVVWMAERRPSRWAAGDMS